MRPARPRPRATGRHRAPARGAGRWLAGLTGALLVARAEAEQRSCEAAPAPAGEAPEPAAELDVLAGPGFALVRGARALAEAGCAPEPIARAVLHDVIERAEQRLGVDAQLAVLLATSPLRCNSIFYLPIANDVRGLGYAHGDGREVFDDSPDSALEGIAFLNDWPYWRERPEEFRSAFLHEVAHRWGARVHARVGEAASQELLGRGLAHWSYFLDTQASPHEGNEWVGEGPGWHTATPAHAARFSPLDLYLMGVLPASQVPAFELLRPVAGAPLDCQGQPVHAASPPQSCGSIEVRGSALTIALDDVIAVEGPRVPEAGVEPRSLSTLVLVLEGADPGFDAASCAELAAAVAARVADFEQATNGGLRLTALLNGQGSCSDAAWSLADAPASEAPAMGCALTATGPSAPGSLPGRASWLLVLGALRWRRRGART